MSVLTVSLGYLCGRGHFCFHDDPDENGACGSKSVGEILVRFAPDEFDGGGEDALVDARDQLHEILTRWRTDD
jgi:hypothetical protein